MPGRLLRGLGIGVAVLVGAAVAVAAIIGVGLLFWLGAKGLIVVTWRAIVDGIKDSLSGGS